MMRYGNPHASDKPRVSIDRLVMFGGPQSYWIETEYGTPVGVVFQNDNGLWSARTEAFPRANHGDTYLDAWSAAKQLQLGTGIGVYRNA